MAATDPNKPLLSSCRVPLTRKDCLRALLSNTLIGLSFAAFAWKPVDHEPEFRWLNAFGALVMLSKAYEDFCNYRRLRQGQIVTVSRLSRRTEWGIGLTIATFILGLITCQVIAMLVNHPHASRPQHFLAALAPLWGLLVWGWKRLPKQ